jgi:phage terminase large subunit-like protein
VEGGRADLIVLDDVSDFRTSIIYPQHREAIKKKIYAEVLPMLDEGGRAISIATPHHQGDVVASLRKNRQWLGRVYSVGNDKDIYSPLWPKKWPRKALIALRSEIGATEYDRAYRCIPVSGESQIVRQEHIRYYTAEMMPDPWALLCLQAYDLAGTVKRRSSYFACVIFLYDPVKNLVFVVDAWHDKLAFVDQAKAIIREAAKWQPDRIVIEETGYQSALRGYLNEVMEIPLPIFPITPGSKSKELRLTETLPMFESERIWFNPSLDSALNPGRMNTGDLIGQLLDFTQASDQDLGDAFAHGITGLRAMRAAGDDGGGSWDTGDGMITRVSVL